MTWLTWRQYRMQLLYGVALLAAVSAFLLPTGLHRFAVFHDSGLAACIGAGQTCMDLHGPLDQAYNSVSPIVGWFHLVPVIVGVLLAAPLVGDLEHRTVRLAWTQSITRERWLVLKLGAAVLAIALFSILFTAIMTWWYAPYDRSAILPKTDVGESFDFEGLMPLSYALFAFAVAMAAGTLTRRVLAAPLVALVAFIVLLTALQNTVQNHGSDAIEVMNGTVVRGPTLALRNMDRFWTVQGIEAAVFLSAATVLIGVSVWLINRRA